MTATTPVVSRSEAVIVELRNRILAGRFTPGFHLQEIPLAEELGVSRTPIREALATLAKEGLLEPGPKRGFKVRIFTLREVMDAYEVRASLEGLAVRLLAERGIDHALRTKIEDALRSGDHMLQNKLTERDHSNWLEMNNAFHTALVDGTRNQMLGHCVEQSYRVPLASSRHVHWYRFDEENFIIARKAHEAHHNIYAAIIAGTSSRAEALMKEHVYFSQDLIAKHFQAQSIGFDTRGALEVRLGA